MQQRKTSDRPSAVGEQWRPPAGSGVGRAIADALRVSIPSPRSVLRSTVVVAAVLALLTGCVVVLDALLTGSAKPAGWLSAAAAACLAGASGLALTVPLSFGDSAEYLSPGSRRRYVAALLLAVAGLVLGAGPWWSV